MFNFEQIMSVLVTYMFTQLVFWTVGGLFLIVDITGRPKAILKYKLQPNKNCPVDKETLLKIAKVSLTNQIVYGLPLTYVNHILLEWRRGKLVFEPVHLIHLLTDLVVCVLIEEFCFYYSHRLLHHPVFYKSIHKKHHEWTAPIGIAAVYAHPLEYIFSNIIPLMLGPIICGSGLLTVWIWFSMAIIYTICHHSGYNIPGISGIDFHDYHHQMFHENFGVLGLLDWLHGTDVKFRQIQRIRNE